MAVRLPEGYVYSEQQAFDAGAFPGMERVPPNGEEDIVNGLLPDDGSLAQRGGGAYKGTGAGSAAQPWRALWDGYLAAGPRTLLTRKEGVNEAWYTLGADDATLVSVGATNVAAGPIRQRPVVLNGILASVFGPATIGAGLTVWAGARGGKADVSQTVSLTNGSRSVVGSGTTWTTQVEAGTLMLRLDPTSAEFRFGVVDSVQDNTHLTLTRPWMGQTQTVIVDFAQSRIVGLQVVNPATTIWPNATAQAFAAAMFDRLIVARGERLGITLRNDPVALGNLAPEWASENYHELPGGARVVGLEPLRDLLLVFSTQGVFALSGVGFDITDDAGNPQQQLERVDPELVLWDNRGVTGWEGAVLAPGVDDVYLIDSAGGSTPITGGMRGLYRSYVKAGYQAGLAAVFRGHYLLPVLNGDVWVDTLVCDLRKRAWMRWAGHSGAVASYARRVADATRPRALLGAAITSDYRVLDVAGAFVPTAANKLEANGTVPSLQVTTRTLEGPDMLSPTWRRFRARYELPDAASDDPSLSLEYATGKPGSSFSSVSGSGSEGEQVKSWAFTEKSRLIRFRLTVNGPTSGFVLRAIRVGNRPSGSHRP